MSDTLRDLENHMRLVALLAMLGARSSSGDDDNEEEEEETKPAGQRLSEYIMVAAIDFGTTFSGYAFSFKSSKGDIKMNKNWGAGIGCQSYKTPTCLLLKPDKSFHTFGYEAQHEYTSLMEQDDKKYYYFERFKMKLHNTKDLGPATTLTATNGKAIPAVDVFAHSLNYLRKHLIDSVKATVSSPVTPDMIRWVITVPAIWSDASKQFMREAAKNGGLIEDLDSGQLVIALEPEAASLHVRQLPVDQFVKQDFVEMGDMKIKPGSRYLVIDAGGGTLDVTAHELQGNRKVKELHYATGGAYGGTRVDDEFIKIVEQIFSKSFIREFQKENPSQWLQMMADFEKKKRACKFQDDGKVTMTNIQLSWSLGSLYQTKKKQSVPDAVTQFRNPGVRFANGMLCLDGTVMQKLFKPVIDGIVQHVTNLLGNPKLQGIKYMFCVGGFSESALLQKALSDNFSNAGVMLVPDEASLAVVKGAVQYGHNPEVISSRVSARTYGVANVSEFRPGIHDKSKAISIDGKIYCDDLLNTYVEQGQEVPVGFSKTETFTPVRDSQHAADIQIYSADRSKVKYITDAGVEHHGSIHVKWPGSGTNRKLKICMTFGGTEVQVEATAYPGGNKTETKLNFYTE